METLPPGLYLHARFALSQVCEVVQMLGSLMRKSVPPAGLFWALESASCASEGGESGWRGTKTGCTRTPHTGTTLLEQQCTRSCYWAAHGRTAIEHNLDTALEQCVRARVEAFIFDIFSSKGSFFSCTCQHDRTCSVGPVAACKKNRFLR